MTDAEQLLTDLRARGVSFWLSFTADGVRAHMAGPLTDDDRAALAARRPAVFACLLSEAQLSAEINNAEPFADSDVRFADYVPGEALPSADPEQLAPDVDDDGNPVERDDDAPRGPMVIPESPLADAERAELARLCGDDWPRAERDWRGRLRALLAALRGRERGTDDPPPVVPAGAILVCVNARARRCKAGAEVYLWTWSGAPAWYRADRHPLPALAETPAE
jgi:hypothetical protein